MEEDMTGNTVDALEDLCEDCGRPQKSHEEGVQGFNDMLGQVLGRSIPDKAVEQLAGDLWAYAYRYATDRSMTLRQLSDAIAMVNHRYNEFLESSKVR